MAEDTIIIVSAGGVRRIVVDTAAGASTTGAAVQEALGTLTDEVVVAIPSAWCLAAHVELQGGTADDHRSLLFRLEEQLPLAAEDIVADFVYERSGKRALGVAARLRQLRTLIEALEAGGLTVRCVSPTALLALQESAAERSDDCFVSMPEGDHVNLMALRDGRLTAWSLVPAGDGRALLREVQVLSTSVEGPPPVERHETLEESAVACGKAILAGRARPWVDLRRGALAPADALRPQRRALNFVLAAAAAFLILLTIGMLVRAQRYQAHLSTLDRQLGEEFARAFPDWPPQSNVRVLIASEFRKAQSQRPHVHPPGGGAGDVSALRTLHDVLSRFPAPGRCDIDQLSFGEGSFELRGRVLSLEDIEPLASAAREAGLQVPPPLTRRGEDGAWTVTLRGARPSTGVAMAGLP